MSASPDKRTSLLFLVFATMTGLAYSIHWIIPFLTELLNLETYAYVPFR